MGKIGAHRNLSPRTGHAVERATSSACRLLLSLTNFSRPKLCIGPTSRMKQFTQYFQFNFPSMSLYWLGITLYEVLRMDTWRRYNPGLKEFPWSRGDRYENRSSLCKLMSTKFGVCKGYLASIVTEWEAITGPNWPFIPLPRKQDDSACPDGTFPFKPTVFLNKLLWTRCCVNYLSISSFSPYRTPHGVIKRKMTQYHISLRNCNFKQQWDANGQNPGCRHHQILTKIWSNRNCHS